MSLCCVKGSEGTLGRGGRDSQQWKLIRMLIFSQDFIHRDVDLTQAMCLESAAENHQSLNECQHSFITLADF